ncbi:hypothetical protein E9228_001548 [Curtobacterium flaccumfaciens]|uniref:Lipoprotein n=1 Tax=Curtobacterium salicis TaxID=1779862 RepID=A0ABX0T605_9MICO|nr:hypothetical protein [Curtobacterium sp. WW7]NII40912.1 hypothetical protein [Curtobacterium sp. WW7]
MQNTTLNHDMRGLSRVLLAATTAALLVAGLTGCSGSDASTAGRAAGATDASGLGAQWGSCMRAAGFAVEDPSDDQVRSGTVLAPQGGHQQAFGTAAAACSSDLGIEQIDSAEKDRWTREYARVASCIRDEFPDYPEQEPGGLALGPEEYPRALEDGFQERADECLRKYSPDTRSQTAG